MVNAWLRLVGSSEDYIGHHRPETVESHAVHQEIVAYALGNTGRQGYGEQLEALTRSGSDPRRPWM